MVITSTSTDRRFYNEHFDIDPELDEYLVSAKSLIKPSYHAILTVPLAWTIVPLV